MGHGGTVAPRRERETKNDLILQIDQMGTKLRASGESLKKMDGHCEHFLESNRAAVKMVDGLIDPNGHYDPGTFIAQLQVIRNILTGASTSYTG